MLSAPGCPLPREHPAGAPHRGPPLLTTRQLLDCTWALTWLRPVQHAPHPHGPATPRSATGAVPAHAVLHPTCAPPLGLEPVLQALLPLAQAQPGGTRAAQPMDTLDAVELLVLLSQVRDMGERGASPW